MSELNTNKPSRTIVLEKAINPKLPSWFYLHFK